MGLSEIPPLTFAGLRYALAFICLLPFAFRKERVAEIKKLDGKNWAKLVLLGFMFYSFTQGAQFVGLSLLHAVSVSLLLNFTPIIVAVMGFFLLSEKPTALQWSGAFLFMVGILAYFYPVDLSGGETLGVLVMIIGVLANSGSAIMGREINRSRLHDPLTVTVISMGVGSIVLLISGLITQGLPSISLTNILLLAWLAIVNTAMAFTLWNLSLRTLTAMESSIINGTMLIQIAILAWIFLGEAISLKEVAGMLIAAIGALLVQLKRKV
ncbi:MAG: DMT family transporter [Bacteroidetes bacterium]|nr:DMT family transporter [Bacteroidota bacterium]MCL6100658.1 DMT family transporter [Bacteroidota bacterium]